MSSKSAINNIFIAEKKTILKRVDLSETILNTQALNTQKD